MRDAIREMSHSEDTSAFAPPSSPDKSMPDETLKGRGWILPGSAKGMPYYMADDFGEPLDGFWEHESQDGDTHPA